MRSAAPPRCSSYERITATPPGVAVLCFSEMVTRQQFAQRKRAVQRRAISNPGRRMRAVRDSSWTTYELLRQAFDLQVISAAEGKRLRAWDEEGKECPWGQSVRTYISWQLSGTRIEWGLADPIHPADVGTG